VISDCIFEVSIEGKIEFINPYGLKILGLTQQDIEHGIDVSDLVSEPDYQELDQNIEQLIKGTDLNPLKVNIRIYNEWVKAEVYAKPRRSENKAVGYSGVLIIKDKHNHLHLSVFGVG
ncbi:MAG TPA: PAS domain S-box protein, partial [Bacteroidetes bacterium]|nr:PAS domain S-box protein [Bacteroidota bacterium]